jgi:hypothetical protein
MRGSRIFSLSDCSAGKGLASESESRLRPSEKEGGVQKKRRAYGTERRSCRVGERSQYRTMSDSGGERKRERTPVELDLRDQVDNLLLLLDVIAFFLAVHPTDLHESVWVRYDRMSGERETTHLNPVLVHQPRRERNLRNDHLELRDPVVERHTPAVIEVQYRVEERQPRQIHSDLERELQGGSDLSECTRIGNALSERRERARRVEVTDVLLEAQGSGVSATGAPE